MTTAAATTGLRISRRHDHGVSVLALSGHLDLAGASAVLSTAGGGDSRPRSMIYDLGDMREPVTPRLLTVFPAALRRMGVWPEQEIHIAGAAPSVMASLHRLGIDRFISVHSTVQLALAAARAGQHTIYQALRLVPVAASPSQARHFTEHLLQSMPDDVRFAADLVTSELTTNAVRHVHEPFTLRLALTDDELLVAVTDISRREPVVRPLNLDADGGRGLQLIDAVSYSWGVRLIHHDGKTVWARMPTAA